ncbi:hypothetical protein SlGVgp061 [Spodoptera litura granulovirus]|uniref:Uncharacterized protein n=1 Tax=Spodoptera litura granulovirus TaxID=359919 RepID=A5IZR3_9BBAC|nr:hypothetical protein SlGVgp061 [Spodoptera litura granulovirus]ABQ52004.1 hypothetical protein SlGVgp061 [Spodoptera litura granulovirus]
MFYSASMISDLFKKLYNFIVDPIGIQDLRIDVRLIMDKLDEIADTLPPQQQTEDDEKGLGVFIKNNIDDSTHVQYVSGNKYKCRKRLYENIMEKVHDDEDEYEPEAKIQKMNDTIVASGVGIEHITDSAIVANASINATRQLLKDCLTDDEES